MTIQQTYLMDETNEGPPENFSLAEFREWFTAAQQPDSAPALAVIAVAMRDLLNRTEWYLGKIEKIIERVEEIRADGLEMDIINIIEAE